MFKYINYIYTFLYILLILIYPKSLHLACFVRDTFDLVEVGPLLVFVTFRLRGYPEKVNMVEEH